MELHLQDDDSQDLGMDLQFQDFGETRTQPVGMGGSQHEQTITFSDFPDSAQDDTQEQDKIGPKIKRLRVEEERTQTNKDIAEDNRFQYEDLTEKKKCKADVHANQKNSYHKKHKTEECTLSAGVEETSAISKNQDKEGCTIDPSEKHKISDVEEKSIVSKNHNEVEGAVSKPAPSPLFLSPETVQITAVLPEGVCGHPELAQVAVLQVKDKRHTSKVIRELSSKLPVPSLSHLKRVRKFAKSPKQQCDTDNKEVIGSLIHNQAEILSNVGNQFGSSKINENLVLNQAEKQDFGIKVNHIEITDIHKPEFQGNSSQAKDEEKLYVYLDFIENLGGSPVETFLDYISPLDKNQEAKILSCLSEKKVELTNCEPEVYVAQVSRYPPKVREMYDKVSPFWPCAFHEDAYLTQLSSSNFFNKTEERLITENMNRALELSRRSNEVVSQTSMIRSNTAGDEAHKSRTLKENNIVDPEGGQIELSHMDKSEVGCRSDTEDNRSAVRCRDDSDKKLISHEVGVVIVDSQNESVVACASDLRHTHPLKHAVMVAIDNVAARQGGGAWTQQQVSAGDNREGCPGVRSSDILSDCDEREDKKCTLKTEKHIEPDNIKTSSNSLTEKNSKISDSGFYICTGYDVYVTREPCMMCAMALLHSRVRRVFYLHEQPQQGALNSRTKLHTLPGINHRYELMGEGDGTDPANLKAGVSFLTFEFYQQFFDVDSKQVGDRILWSMVPKPGVSYLQSYIRPNPDLYGPFWICVTLAFTTAITGNLANYLATKDNEAHVWRYEFRKVTLAASAIFAYACLIPIGVWGLLVWRGSRAKISLLELFCVYGYSLAIFVPVSILWMVPQPWFKWCLAIVAPVLSGGVLVRTVWPTLSHDTRQVALSIAAFVLLLHATLALGFMLYFFTAPEKDVKPIIETPVVSPALPDSTPANPVPVKIDEGKAVAFTGSSAVKDPGEEKAKAVETASQVAAKPPADKAAVSLKATREAKPNEALKDQGGALKEKVAESPKSREAKPREQVETPKAKLSDPKTPESKPVTQ